VPTHNLQPSTSNRPTTRSILTALLAGTPGRLRITGAAAIAAVIIFAGLSANAALNRQDAINTAADRADQMVRVTAVRTDLVEADAYATNAFLVGGLEPAAARANYENNIAAAAATLADVAAAADDADLAALQTASSDLTRYTGLIESARANNRQGFPVGVAYLRQASQLMRDSILPSLDAVTDTTTRDVDNAFDNADNSSGLLITTAGALAVLAAAQLFLSRRTRRTLNIPLLIATGAVLIASVLAGALGAVALHQATTTRDGAYTNAVALATARTQAFDAKSAESLTLIARGSGDIYEERFTSGADATLDALNSIPIETAGPSLDAFTAYLDVHNQIRELDNAGRWDDAVALATGTGDDTPSANNLFADFDDASQTALDRATSTTTDTLTSGSGLLTVAALALIAAGIIGGFAAWRGISIRLREYR
jgi:hypothetical protein